MAFAAAKTFYVMLEKEGRPLFNAVAPFV